MKIQSAVITFFLSVANCQLTVELDWTALKDTEQHEPAPVLVSDLNQTRRCLGLTLASGPATEEARLSDTSVTSSAE